MFEAGEWGEVGSEALDAVVAPAGDGGAAGPGVMERDLVDPFDLLELEDALPAEPTVRAAELAERLPGSELAWLVEHVDTDTLGDGELVELVAAWQRLASWASAGAARAAAALAERPSMNPAWPAHAGEVAEPVVAGEELAMRLGCSRRAARTLVMQGRAFAGPLAWTGDALARGEIDPVKARVICEALADVPVPVALEVQDRVLAGASWRTPTQLGRDVARALIEVDPAAAADRHQDACRGRRVDAPRVLPHGMAGVWAVLPATGAARLEATLTTLARSARTAGDPRTLDQLRADLLVDLTTGAVDGTPARELVDLLREAEQPGHAGAGVATRRPAAGDDASGACACGDGQVAEAGPVRRPLPRTEIRVAVSLSTLLGLDDAPADLSGYGPITAEAARALALGGVWRRIVTDPLSGAVLDVGRTRYRPPADLAAHVRVRDRACARPGCPATAETCDLDHTRDFHESGGPTAAHNLAPLCRRDHQIKTHAGYHLSQPEPGVLEWTTPTGHRYRIRPGGDGPYEHHAPDPPPP